MRADISACVQREIFRLMIFYITGIVILIAASRNSKLSNVIAKIIRVKLEIYSTVLFSSIIKTVFTYNKSKIDYFTVLRPMFQLLSNPLNSNASTMVLIGFSGCLLLFLSFFS